jgi:hypothetical protein
VVALREGTVGQWTGWPEEMKNPSAKISAETAIKKQARQIPRRADYQPGTVK